MALTPVTTTATGKVSVGTSTDTFVSSVDLLHSWDIVRSAFDRYYGSDFLWFMENTGRVSTSTQTTIYHYELGWLLTGSKILSVTNPGAGANTTIVIDPVSLDNSISNIRDTDTVIFKNNLAGYVVSGGGTNTLVVRPATATMNLGAGLAAGDYLSVMMNARPEGGTYSGSLQRKPFMYSATHQIFTEQYKGTGTEATNMLSIEWNGKKNFIDANEIDLHARYRERMSVGLLFQPAMSNVTDRTTAGLYDVMRSRSTNKITPLSWSSSDWDDLALSLDAERVSEEVTFNMGNALYYDVQNSITDVMKMGGIQYNSFGKGDAKQRAIDMGFDSIRRGKYTIHLKNLYELNHPQYTALPGFSYPQSGFIMPTDTLNDAKSGEALKSINLKFKSMDKENRRYKFWKRDITITNTDEIEYNYLSEVALQVIGANRFVLYEA